MAAFLSDEWVAELDRAAREVRAPDEIDLVLQQVVVDESGPQAEYVIRIAEGRISVFLGRTDVADVTLTQDRSTAAEIARGKLSAQTAFMDGRLRIGGDLRRVVNRALDLSALADVFAAARNATTW